MYSGSSFQPINQPDTVDTPPYSITDVAGSMVGPETTMGAFSTNQYPNYIRNFIANNVTGDNGSPLSTRNHFLNLLDQWQFSLPLNQLWMVFFNVPRLVSNEAMATWGERIINVADDKLSI